MSEVNNITYYYRFTGLSLSLALHASRINVHFNFCIFTISLSLGFVYNFRNVCNFDHSLNTTLVLFRSCIGPYGAEFG